MSTQHTPGPWSVQPFYTPQASDDPLGVYRIEEAAKELEVIDDASYDAEPNSEEEQKWIDARSNKQVANRRLIASAPELLAALQSINKWLEEPIDYREQPEQIAWANGIAKAAIAKATTNS